jgi:chromosome segregation ATPase
MSNTNSYEKAQAELAAIVSEQATLPHKIAEAAHAGDASAILKWQRRSDELPAHVFVARARLLKARLADLEARKAQLAEERAPVFAEIEEAERRVREAEAALASAQQNLQDTKGAEYDISYQIGRTKIELERLIAENSNAHAPVVRSLPHAT